MSSPHGSEWWIRLAFFAVGVINLLPVAGLVGRQTMERAYGINLGDGHDLTILMQHRALLFGLLSSACFAATFVGAWRTPVAIAALISMLGFAVIAATQAHGSAIAKIMWIDIAASLVLAMGWLLHFKSTP